MSKWDRSTRNAWQNSEVAQEFEKYVIDLSKKLEAIAQQKLQQVIPQVKELGQDLGKVKEGLDAISNMAEDEAKEDDINKANDKKLEEDASEKLLIAELKQVAEAAADMGNIKLAYRIERTISEISGE
jgi:hypothetical protein